MIGFTHCVIADPGNLNSDFCGFCRLVLLFLLFAGSSNGRTAVSGTVSLGSNPSPAANLDKQR